jgi:hypothetical protein
MWGPQAKERKDSSKKRRKKNSWQKKLRLQLLLKIVLGNNLLKEMFKILLLSQVLRLKPKIRMPTTFNLFL